MWHREYSEIIVLYPDCGGICIHVKMNRTILQKRGNFKTKKKKKKITCPQGSVFVFSSSAAYVHVV